MMSLIGKFATTLTDSFMPERVSIPLLECLAALWIALCVVALTSVLLI